MWSQLWGPGARSLKQRIVGSGTPGPLFRTMREVVRRRIYQMKLHQYLLEAAHRWPGKVAIQELDGSSITYQELDRQSDRLRDRLTDRGVGPGDRVGFWLRKSIDAVATLFAILKVDAAYVPIDPTGPPARNNYILADCEVAAIVTERRFKPMLETQDEEEWRPASLPVDQASGGDPLAAHVRAGELHRSVFGRDRRSRLHPLHLGLDGQTKRGAADAWQRGELRRVVRRSRCPHDRIGSRRMRRSISTCRSSTSTAP